MDQIDGLEKIFSGVVININTKEIDTLKGKEEIQNLSNIVYEFDKEKQEPKIILDPPLSNHIFDVSCTNYMTLWGLIETVRDIFNNEDEIEKYCGIENCYITAIYKMKNTFFIIWFEKQPKTEEF